ncbi:MAG: hypothetical protein EZS28_030469 [Streblomastix strix]|uniref:Uncharacterized protein n=1 Tax=Streblomastix strix TaxID=222440 RepID=A0A5J4UTR1_9EUKA|nr:MAG: hypothetical protein EZS28_030469 [Streblomastix strix]
MTAIETISDIINESAQTEPFNSTKQGRPKKYTDKEQAMIAAREQRKNARIRFKQNQTNYVSKVQQVGQAATQTVERLIQNETATRNINNLLIPPIPAYPQQQTSRIPLQPYTTERNQQQRQNINSISPAHKRADESENDDFLDEIISGITMSHLPPHKIDIETVQ